MIRFKGNTRGFSDIQMDLLLRGLKFEIDTGMYMTDPRKIGGSCYSIAKKEFGFKGSKSKVYGQLEDMRNEALCKRNE